VDFRKSGCDEGRHPLDMSTPPQCGLANDLSAEAIKSLALPLESVDHVHSGDGLAASVLSVGDRVADDVLKEDLEHAAGLLVDETGDALHAAATSETSDGGLGDTLDVVAEDLAMALGAALSETFTSFSATRHDELNLLLGWRRWKSFNETIVAILHPQPAGEKLASTSSDAVVPSLWTGSYLLLCRIQRKHNTTHFATKTISWYSTK
jgi:hypothetical protein